MGALLFSHFWVTKVNLINEKNSIDILVWMSADLCKSILLLRFLRISYNNMSWSCPGTLKSRSAMDVVFNRWESFISLLGATSHWFKRDLNSKILKRDFQQPTIMGAPSNINLSSSLYWYATLKSCKYLKSKTHLWNAQVNKYSSVKKGVVKIWQRHDPEDFSTSYITLLPFAASSVPMKHIGLLGHCLIWLILLYL